MRTIGLLLINVLLLGLSPAAAQSAPTPTRAEVAVTAGSTDTFRFDDQSFGRKLSLGGAARARVWGRLGVHIEANRVIGLEPRPANCPVVHVVCQGSGRNGVLAATMVSVAVESYLRDAGVRPYISAGMGVMWSHSINTTIVVSGSTATLREREFHNRGFGFTAGVGLAVPVGEHVLLRPEWRFYDGSLISSMNLSMTRASLAAGYRW